MQRSVCDGTWATMVTPFQEDGSIDYRGVESILAWYKRYGVDGVFAVCQSSEMFFLSLRERTELAAFVIDKAKDSMQVVVSGHVSESIEDQIVELRAMAKLEPHSVVIVTNRLARPHESDALWKENATRILDAIPEASFGLYECPQPYKRLMSPELLRWCAETGRFIFLKDTCSDIGAIRRKMEAVAGTSLKVFNANAATLLASLQAGASGFCGVMLNFHPDVYRELCHNWRADQERAERLQSFATMASLMELQQYPTNAKYHMGLDGVPIGYNTRSRNPADFGALEKIEVDALYALWKGTN